MSSCIQLVKFILMPRLIIILLATIMGSGLTAQDIDELVLKDAGTDTEIELANLKSAKASVIIFFGNRCAYNTYYINRINKLAMEFSPKGLEFFLINSNRSDVIVEESPENMKQFLSRHNLKLPYLIDADQALKKALGATRSPEVFLLKSKQGKLQVFYSGAIDDSPQSEGDVSHPFLKEAILSLLQNETPAVRQVRPTGCLIR
jgi:peroxiredoxin